MCAALRVTWAPGGKWSCGATGVKSQPVLGAAECVVSPPGCALHSWLLFCLSRCALSEPVLCPSLLMVSPRSFSVIPASLGSQIAARMGFLCLLRGGPGRPGSPGGLLASLLASRASYLTFFTKFCLLSFLFLVGVTTPKCREPSLGGCVVLCWKRPDPRTPLCVAQACTSCWLGLKTNLPTLFAPLHSALETRRSP